MTTYKLIQINTLVKKVLADLTGSENFVITQGGKNYKLASQYLINDVVTNLLSDSDTKQLAASQGKVLKLLNDWLNEARGFIYDYSAIWTTAINASKDVVVTIPTCDIIRINEGSLNSVGSISGTIKNNGGLVLNWDSVNFTYTIVDDLTTVIEGVDLSKWVIVKNSNGKLISSIPSVNDSLYNQQLTVTDLSWDFDISTVDADPGLGEFRMNNVDPALVTELYISKESKQAIDVTNELLTSSGSIQITQISDQLKFIIGTEGVVVDNTGYVTIPITITDSGVLFTSGAECETSLFYVQEDTQSDITRNEVELAVSASSLVLDFSSKNECWATKVSGGAIVVNENITISRANDTNKKTDYTFISVTGATREITLPAATISSEVRWSSGTNKLTLEVGKYLLKRSYDGTNEFLSISDVSKIPLAGIGVANGGFSDQAQALYGNKSWNGEQVYQGLADFEGVATFFDEVEMTGLSPNTTGDKKLVITSPGVVGVDNPAYIALTAGAAVAYSLITGLNKTLNVAVDTTITFSNMASRLGEFGTIRLNVTVSSDIILAGATFKGIGNLLALATGIYHIAFTVVSSTEIDYNINTTPYA